MRTLACLSISNPWAWLIVQGHKNLENRDWKTSYRGRILIHAGKKLDTNGFDGDALFTPYWYQAGAHPDVVACMPRHKTDYSNYTYQTGGIVGIATLVDVVSQSDSPWFRGTYGFIFKDARPLPFIPLRGQLGVFPVDLQVIEEAILRHTKQLKIDWQGIPV